MEYIQLKNIINKYDPAGLLSLGAPDSEYEVEIQSILNKLNKNHNLKNVKTIVYEIFFDRYGKNTLSGAEQLLDNIASEILKNKQN